MARFGTNTSRLGIAGQCGGVFKFARRISHQAANYLVFVHGHD